MNTDDERIVLDPTIELLERFKESAKVWQERRHAEWKENYLLYRNKPELNRLTQRQSVTVPLIKTSISTALKEVDDPPLLTFTCLDNDKDAEILYNEGWKKASKDNRLVLKDIVDKKQVFLYGRSFKKLNIVDGAFKFDILDPYDVPIDRYVDPTSLDSTKYLVHQHIFKPLSEVVTNEAYDKEARESLVAYMASEAGILKANENNESIRARNERLAALGVADIDNPVLGETYIEINEHYLRKWNSELKVHEFYIITTAQSIKLLEKRLEDVLGVTEDNFWRSHIPFTSWADDTENADFWSDGMADTLRTPNKILNTWLSQLTENRTLRNFGMNFYDATIKDFTPQTYEARPWGWYGLPGKPSDVYQKADIPDLSESLDEMEFVLRLAEKASASTSIQQGVSEERQITLGEVQILMANATERVKAMSTFYTADWEQFGLKYVKLLEANYDKLDDIVVHRKGRYNDEIFTRRIKGSELRSKKGYHVEVVPANDKESQDLVGLQKLNAIIQSIPNNKPLVQIYQRKLLEFGGLTPDETKEVLDFEDQKAEPQEELSMGQNPNPQIPQEVLQQ